jgi:hypothetical protein
MDNSLLRMSWRSFSSALGLALVIDGRLLGWILRWSVGLSQGAIFTVLPMAVGLLLLIDPRWIRGANLRVSPLNLAAPTLLMIFPIVAVSLEDLGRLAPQSGYLLLLCPIALCVALKDAQDFAELPFAVMIVGLLGELGPYFQLAIQGAGKVVEGRVGAVGADGILVLADVGVITAFSALVVSGTRGKQSWPIGTIAAFAFAIGVAGVFISVTRSAMLSLLLCVLAYLLILRGRITTPSRERKAKSWAFGIILTALAIAAPLILSAVVGDKLFDFLSHWAVQRVQGTLDFFENTSRAVDGSSVAHLALMQYNWDHAAVFGHGMMAMSNTYGEGVYAHESHLQAAYDLGLIVAIAYFLLTAIIPGSFIVLRLLAGPISGTDALTMLWFLTVKIDGELFHSGPYNWDIWMSTLLVFVLLSRPIVNHKSAPDLGSIASPLPTIPAL